MSVFTKLAKPRWAKEYDKLGPESRAYLDKNFGSNMRELGRVPNNMGGSIVTTHSPGGKVVHDTGRSVGPVVGSGTDGRSSAAHRAAQERKGLSPELLGKHDRLMQANAGHAARKERLARSKTPEGQRAVLKTKARRIRKDPASFLRGVAKRLPKSNLARGAAIAGGMGIGALAGAGVNNLLKKRKQGADD